MNKTKDIFLFTFRLQLLFKTDVFAQNLLTLLKPEQLFALQFHNLTYRKQLMVLISAVLLENG